MSEIEEKLLEAIKKDVSVIKKIQSECKHDVAFMTLTRSKGVQFCPKCLICSDDNIPLETRLTWKTSIEKMRKEFDTIEAHREMIRYIKKVARRVFALQTEKRSIILVELKILKEIGFKDWADLIAHPPEYVQKKIDGSIYKEYFKK